MFNSNSVHVFAMRHAKPLDNDDEDPGLHPDSEKLVDEAAGYIAKLMPTSGAIVIYTSPSRRAIETGRMLLDGRLKGVHQSEPNVTTALDELTIMRMTPQEQRAHWNSTLYEMAGKLNPAIAINEPSLIIVTHEPALYTIPQLQSQQVNPDYAAVNHFKLNV